MLFRSETKPPWKTFFSFVIARGVKQKFVPEYVIRQSYDDIPMCGFFHAHHVQEACDYLVALSNDRERAYTLEQSESERDFSFLRMRDEGRSVRMEGVTMFADSSGGGVEEHRDDIQMGRLE